MRRKAQNDGPFRVERNQRSSRVERRNPIEKMVVAATKKKTDRRVALGFSATVPRPVRLNTSAYFTDHNLSPILVPQSILNHAQWVRSSELLLSIRWRFYFFMPVKLLINFPPSQIFFFPFKYPSTAAHQCLDAKFSSTRTH